MISKRSRSILVSTGVVVTAALLLSACSGGGGKETDDHSVKIVTAVEPSGVEPCNAENGAAVILRYNVIQSLTDLDVDTREAVPLLATSWERTGDTTWVFNLRDGVKFHDGADLDAEAAAFGINRSLNNDAIACSNTAKVGDGVVLTPEATGPLELTITTSIPDPILPLELSYIDLVSPNTPADEETDEPIGTGPYTWTAWNRGKNIVVDRWDGYWGDKPDVEHAEVLFRQEDSVRANVIKTGEADIGLSISDQDAPESDNTKTYPLDATFSYRLPSQSEPFSDMRVRQAFAMSIDKETIVPSILGRTGVPASQLVTESNNGYSTNYEDPGYQPDAAKKLLEEAANEGIDVSTEVDLVAFNGQFPGSDELQQAVQQNLQSVGFNVKLQIVDSPEWNKLLFKPFPVEQKPTVLAVKHDNSSGDASSSFTSYIATSGCCGAATNKHLDELLGTALSAEGDARTSAFQEVADYEYNEDLTIVGVASLQGLMLLSDRVEYEPNALTNRNKFELEAISFTQ